MRGCIVGGAVALLSLAMASSAMAANPLDDLIKPQANNSACFSRVYDAAHLRAHPKQKTTAMTVWLKYEKAHSASDLILGVALAIVQRGDPAALFSQGGCGWDARANRDTANNRLIKTYPKEAGTVCMQSARPDVFETLSAEEGGALIIDRGRDRDTLMVYLDEALTMVKRADRADQLGIDFGADDRVFMLRRTGAKECDFVKEAVTAPEPGAR
jgi:hypothetical protein